MSSTATTSRPDRRSTDTGDQILRLAVTAVAFVYARPRRRRPSGEEGQATAEYALVLLGAAAIALLVVSWATKTNVVGRLLDLVFGQLTSRATSPKAG